MPNRKTDFCPRLMVWQHLIPIIDKEKILWEADNENGMMFGFSGNYIRVARPFEEKYINQITEEELTKLDKSKQYFKL